MLWGGLDRESFMAEDNTSAMRFVMHGRVQGVGFRAATRRHALALGLRGWVRNLPYGTVEAYAVGTASTLTQCRQWLATGPAMARVTAVDHVAEAVEPCQEFIIRRD